MTVCYLYELIILNMLGHACVAALLGFCRKITYYHDGIKNLYMRALIFPTDAYQLEIFLNSCQEQNKSLCDLESLFI